jgi:hypothetical protein
MPKFIQVTQRKYGPAVVSADHIRMMSPMAGGGTLINFGLDSESEPDYILVEETVPSLLALIEGAQ